MVSTFLYNFINLYTLVYKNVLYKNIEALISLFLKCLKNIAERKIWPSIIIVFSV